MAIFKKEKEIKKEVVSTQKESNIKSLSMDSFNADNILKRPRITEKASMMAEKNVYVFEVDKRANKVTIKQAVKEIYKVNPIKVNIVNSPSKSITVKGIKGVKSGIKKAFIYLKEGDSIEII